MPLLCISPVALLLLPLALSCNRALKDLSKDYSNIVKKDIDLTKTGITASLLQNNSSCIEMIHKPHNCTSDDTDVVRTIHKLICRMKHQKLNQTQDLVSTVLHSLDCRCEKRHSNEKSRRHLMERRAANRQQTKKLCKAEAILSAMTVCYEMLSVEAASNGN